MEIQVRTSFFQCVAERPPSFQSVTLLLGDTSTKVLFGALPCASTLVLCRDGNEKALSFKDSVPGKSAHPDDPMFGFLSLGIEF
jgi:hypothetical protein